MGYAQNNIIKMLCGFLSGLINGIFGAGAGIICVPLLNRAGLSVKKAHSTAIAIVFPLCAISSLFYVKNSSNLSAEALPFIIGGCFGAVIGAFLLKKMSDTFLRRAFGAFMVYSAVRMLWNG